MRRLRLVDAPPVSETGPAPRTWGDLFLELRDHLLSGGEGLEFRLNDLAIDYANAPLSDPQR